MVKLTGNINPKASMTGSIAVAQGSVMNDYEKLINKPLVFDSSANFPPTGNVERLYIATNVNKIYYWTGTTYADISGSGGGTGTDGKSPYVGENGNWYVYNDVLHAWVDTGVRAEGKDGLNGADGKDGTNGINGLDGANGIDGINGTDGSDGEDGKSAYQVWLDNGNTGTELEFLNSLKGLQGERGTDGIDGTNGNDGVDGTNGTNGIDGIDGKSAYEIAIENGFIGTEAEWIASLKGADGKDGKDGINGVDGTNGIDGENGYTPIKGTDYLTPADIASLGINPTVITDLTSTTQTTTLINNTECRYGTLTSLTITWTTPDIHSAIAFTGGTGVVFSITAGVKIVGTDVTDGVFAPVKDKRYNLGFEFDGVNRTMYVSGVI